MTRVDFHFNTADKLAYGCRLLRKIQRAGHRTVVYCDDAQMLGQFDELLWTFSREDFVAHVMADSPMAEQTSIVLASTETDTEHHDVIVNLGSSTPPHFGRFERLVELVSQAEADRVAARERWRFYRDRGYPLERHDLTAQ